MLKNMQHLEEVCHGTLVNEDNERIISHKMEFFFGGGVVKKKHHLLPQRYFHKGWVAQLLNWLLIDGGVCRAAPDFAQACLIFFFQFKF